MCVGYVVILGVQQWLFHDKNIVFTWLPGVHILCGVEVVSQEGVSSVFFEKFIFLSYIQSDKRL